MRGLKVKNQQTVSHYQNETRHPAQKEQGTWARKFYPANETVQHHHDIKEDSQIIPHVVRTPHQTEKPGQARAAIPTRLSPINKVVKSYAKDGGGRMGSVRHGVKHAYPSHEHNHEMMRSSHGASHEEVHAGYTRHKS